ncbi:MAG: hypothetical protein EOO01_39690, partial [Chitinophagaceae bacterium]
MYKHYQEAILKYYEERKSKGDLSLNLQQPAPSKIRDECAQVYQSNPNRRDVSTFISFFEIKEGADILKVIERFDIDRFRPVVNYMKRVTAETEHKNLELLALLLNFPGRPFDKNKNYDVEASQDVRPPDPIPPPTNPITENPTSIQPLPQEPGHVFSIRVFIQRINEWLDKRKLQFRVGGIAALGLVTAIYLDNKGSSAYGNITPGNASCMIWTGDRFLQISCDSNVRKGIKVPLDKERLQNLFRITTPDTLKKEHIKN